MLALFGGLMQTIVGLVEMVSRDQASRNTSPALDLLPSLTCLPSQFLGNTWGATVFCSFGSFNFTYAALYLPGESRLREPFPSLSFFALLASSLYVRFPLPATLCGAFGPLSAPWRCR